MTDHDQPQLPLEIPEDADAGWNPPGYTPGPDEPGPVTAVHEGRDEIQDQA